MFLKHISAHNFRTLTNFSLDFTEHYATLCGKNNSGKSNIVRVIRYMLSENDPYYWGDGTEIFFKRDRTAWDPKSSSSPISLQAQLELDRTHDAGLVEFIGKFLPSPHTIATPPGPVFIDILAEIGPTHDKEKLRISVDSATLDEFSSQEVIKKLRSSSACVYHNSTSVMRQRYSPGTRLNLINALPDDRQKKLIDKQRALSNEISRCVEPHRDDIAEMLGRLSDKYDVTLNVPSFTVDQLPFGISLGDKGYSVPLDEWGSGTRNRTMILRTLFEARQAARSKKLSDRLKPIVVIEEPESFLHPSAQAEFGGVLQDLAQEFQIQVLVTSHSPYMLSHKNQDANILLARKVSSRKSKGSSKIQLKETERLLTSGTDWKQPFEHALGVSGPEFEHLKAAIFSNAKEVILVEGQTDKEYFDDLMDESHGDNRLILKGSVVSYDGSGNLENGALVKFLIGLFKVPIITFDLDKAESLSKKMDTIGLQKGKHYFAIGRDAEGYRSIEGLLPQDITSSVFHENIDLVMALRSDKSDARKNAGNKIKRLCRDKFKAKAIPKTDQYSEFYKLTRLLNKAIAELRGASA